LPDYTIDFCRLLRCERSERSEGVTTMGREDQGLDGSRGRYCVIPRTLCFITHGDDVLLLRGGPNKRLWAGLYNGVGGHLEPDEDIYNGLLREVREETGLQVYDVRLRLVSHVDAGNAAMGIMIFVFTAVATGRAVTPSEEGSLEWMPNTNLPLHSMVEDLPLWLPRILAMTANDPPFFAKYHYDEANQLRVTLATAQ
jgi:8-oxo-dGTP diphosphatase